MSYTLQPTLYADEIQYFEKYLAVLPKKAKLVEWGSGGSTTMFLDHLKPRQTLISIEHKKEWFDKVAEALQVHPRRKQLTQLHIPPKDDMFLAKGYETPWHFWGYGSPFEENPSFLEEYIDPELHSPDVKVFDADFFLVDGIARGACLAAIRVKARKDAEVFIHDYTGREAWYDWAVDLYSRREQVGETLYKLQI